jgi:protein SCO1
MKLRCHFRPCRMTGNLAAVFLLPLVVLVTPVWGHHSAGHQPPGVLREVAFDQRMNGQVPLDLVFHDEDGNPVRFGDFLGERPLLLTLSYYECPMLCPLVLDGLLRTLRALAFTIGEEFTVVTVSFDPGESPPLASAKKAHYMRAYGRDGAAAGWHFLTGEAGAIEQLTQAVGFRFAYDAAKDQYAHAAGVIVLTPQGRVARYFYGLEFSPRDVRLALVEAAAGTIGSPVDQLLLYCYQYDPASGAYTLLVHRVLRLAGVATVLVLGGFMIVMFRREKAAERA